MPLKRPPGNTVVLALLRSRAHRVMSGMAVELRYTGRRSGREYGLPVQYARWDDRLVLWPQAPERKSWWRNFEPPRPVAVLLAGRTYRGTARVVDRDGPGWADARAVYAARWPRMSRRIDGPLVVVTLDARSLDA